MNATTTQRSWAHYTEPAHVAVGGLETAYRRKGAGEPVLYLHGAGLTRMWLPLYEELSRSTDVIVPEHPGFGDTPMPDWLQSFDDLVLHYDALLRALDVERPHLVAHSLGGWIAMNLAIFYPERFRSLTLITPAGLRLPGVPHNDIFRMSPEEEADAVLNGQADRYADYFTQEGELEDTLHAYAESITLARLAWNPRYDLRLDHRLARVQAPTIVLRPDEDRIVPLEACARAAELIPDARVIDVPGADGESTSHLLIIQQPRQIAELVLDHVRANAGSAA